MQKDRFLTGILVGIGVLVALALILFFVRDRDIEYVDESTPAGVVQNYVLALQQRDYERAYSYIAGGENTATQELFLNHFASYGGDEVRRTTVEIGETLDFSENRATVQVVIIRGSGGIFDNVYRDTQSVNLRREEGEWKITAAPYPFWDYSWSYPEPPGK